MRAISPHFKRKASEEYPAVRRATDTAGQRHTGEIETERHNSCYPFSKIDFGLALRNNTESEIPTIKENDLPVE